MVGVGPTTLFKYYQTKGNPVVAISAAARSREWALAAEQRGIERLLHFTAYEMIRYYTDWIICLYKEQSIYAINLAIVEIADGW